MPSLCQPSSNTLTNSLLPPVTRTTRDGFTGSRYRVLQIVCEQA